MKTPGESTSVSSDGSLDQSVEQILGKAMPRPVPSAEETKAVRDNVHVEWRTLTNRRKTNRRLVSFAIAASILLIVFAGFNAVRMGGVSETQVASIGKRFGSIYMLGDNSELLERNNVSVVIAGQTIITDADSGIAVAWADGGSLRIDEETRVEFLSRDAIYLRSGRVYFDSKPELLPRSAIGATQLTIVTDHGEVTHVGTQYMTQADVSSVTISVREGEARLESASFVESAVTGQQLQARDGASTSVVNIKSYGDNWRWIERTSPAAVLDGRSLHDFLAWVSHETGMALEYANADIEIGARNDLLKGTVDTDPTSALRVWMLGTDLQWDIQDGVIHINNSVTGNGPISDTQN